MVFALLCYNGQLYIEDIVSLCIVPLGIVRVWHYLTRPNPLNLCCPATYLSQVTAVCYILRYYRKTANISRTLVGSKIVDNSDVVGAAPVGAAPTTSSLST